MGSPESKFSGIQRYFQALQSLQTEVIEAQEDILERIASRMAHTIARGGRIFVFGSGHSHMMAEEGFFRAGGLAAVVPIFSSALMLHEDPEVSGRLERTGGLAAVLLNRYDPQPDEIMLVFSNSGVNQLPVEMAVEAGARGLFVVAVLSLAYAKISPLSEIGRRLDEVSDAVIDNGGQPGDALVAIPGFEWRVGPTSTIVTALIWNCLVTETVNQLQQAGAAVPVFASLNMPGAQEHNRVLINQWRKLNPHL
ncbi:MAG TPA: SIS domain-containing protein [Anaerolineales bacterium]